MNLTVGSEIRILAFIEEYMPDMSFLRELDEPRFTTNFSTLYKELDFETVRNLMANPGTIATTTKEEFDYAFKSLVRTMKTKVYHNDDPTGDLWVLSSEANVETLEFLKKESFADFKIYQTPYLTDNAVLVGIKDPTMTSYVFAPYILRQSKDGLEFIYAVKLIRDSVRFYGRIEIG